MAEPWERLRAARIAAGYETAAQAAEAMGVKPAGYVHHENGLRPLTLRAERYARFLRVSLDWLVTGRGEMRAAAPAPLNIKVVGYVGAGATVEAIDDPDPFPKVRSIEMPDADEVAAYVVRGDSQWPRFLDGELILFDPRAVAPSELVDQYAIVQTADGRKLIKLLRRFGADGWRLESHNAAPEDDVVVLFAWRYLATLPRLDSAPIPVSVARSKPRRDRRGASKAA